MKQLLVVLTLGIFLTSCDNQQLGTELRLDGILACGRPHLDVNHGQVDEWKTEVISYLTSEGFTILSSRLDHEDIDREGIFCGNCWPTGDQLFVTIPDDQIFELKALGFYEE